ncbi:hypothetical protein FSP39_002288, partial [Pinctada imbricata]
EDVHIQEDVTPTKIVEPKVSGGRWDYVIGLVGKPSAGKSTFFNAATTLDLARTGAHPFTTIEPNIGKAFYSIPCPCRRLTGTCNAANGHNYAGDRNIPVLLKDVAGLVPGAWEGKGKGNRFLNDLLDADVLIHIVDSSGQTNEKGEITTDYDPASDIQWLQQELHQWIYQNVFSKWDNIIKRPHRLVDMFTGYHANKATILTAFHNAGINERLSTVHDNVIPVSAQGECYLQKLTKDGAIQYTSGQSDFDIVSDLKLDDAIREKLDFLERTVFKRYGGCNVHEALCRAVRLRSPVYAYPIHCLSTLQSIGKPHSAGRDVLRDCISVKPGTTVEELYNIMCHYPINLISGDFVRAEVSLSICLSVHTAINRKTSQCWRDVLRDCISVKPGTTVEELYNIMCHYPINLISGDFVRAEVSLSICLSVHTAINRKTSQCWRDVLMDCISVKPGTTVEELYNIMCHYPINLISGDFVRAEVSLSICLSDQSTNNREPHSAGRDVLRDCISVKPGTTVEELYNIMCHYPINLISGDFVRAEVSLSVHTAINRKTSQCWRDVLRDCNSVKPGTTVEELYNIMCHYPINLISGDFVRAEVSLSVCLPVCLTNLQIIGNITVLGGTY